jgi:REP element-mobilizing transposase RayT
LISALRDQILIQLQAGTVSVSIAGMPRRLRLQYSGAIYHLMARGNGGQEIVCDDADRERLVEYLGREAIRCSWQVYAFVIMSNHLHAVLRTAEPNLARGMQNFLSGYANAWARRHRFSGHVFQGRYRTELVENESYLWTVTRYVHLNPVRAALVEDPAAWRWSSYPGYARDRHRLDWVAYDDLLASWAAEFGGSGSEPARTYRRYCMAGVSEPPDSPWSEAYHGWILGSQKFVDRVKAMVGQEPKRERRRESRRIRGLSISRVSQVVCAEYGIEPSALAVRGSRHPARAAIAYLARRHTPASNRELTALLGLSRPESVPNLTRRFQASLKSDPRTKQQLRRLDEALSAGELA